MWSCSYITTLMHLVWKSLDGFSNLLLYWFWRCWILNSFEKKLENLPSYNQDLSLQFYWKRGCTHRKGINHMQALLFTWTYGISPVPWHRHWPETNWPSGWAPTRVAHHTGRSHKRQLQTLCSFWDTLYKQSIVVLRWSLSLFHLSNKYCDMPPRL